MAINGLAFQSSSVATTAYVDASHGLTLITPTSIANSGGSASASGGLVTFSGVTSVSINGVFSSTYSNYKIIVQAQLAAGYGANEALRFRLRNAGSDISSGSYNFRKWEVTGAGGNNLSGASQTAANFSSASAGGASLGDFTITKTNNFAVTGTYGYQGSDGVQNTATTAFSVASAVATYDGFTIYPDASTLSGFIRIYGFRNS